MPGRPPLSRYDYGYLRAGGADWFGGAMAYYGPPVSFWYSVLPWVIPILLGLTVSALAVVPGG
jgi:hypothetical protein